MSDKMHNVLSINDLPPEKLPDFWNDNARINALYAPFRDRTVNPRDWESKLNFWKSLINSWATYNRICTFSEGELKQCFIRNGRVPACLNIVLCEMLKNKELQTLEHFSENQKSWTSWAVDLAFKKPILWSFNKVKSTFLTPVSIETQYVHIPSLTTSSDRLFLSIPEEHRNKLISLNDLLHVSNCKDIDNETVKLLLNYLQSRYKIDIFYIDNDSSKEKMLIKVCPINCNKVTPISEIDIGIYNLEHNEKALFKKIEDLEHKKIEAAKNVKIYLARGMRQLAKTCLRKQHELEKRIEKQANVLENVQTLLHRINVAESDSKVLESYRNGLTALKSVLKENGLTEDIAADTMVEIADVLESHDDIQATLSQPISSTMDDELEQELADLLNDTSQSPSSQFPGSGSKIPMVNKNHHSQIDNLSSKRSRSPSPTSGSKIPLKNDDQELEERLRNLKLPSVPDDSPEQKSKANLSPFI